MNKWFLLVSLACIIVFSCATKKKNSTDTVKSEEKPAVEIQPINEAKDASKDMGMLVYIGATPSEVLEEALANKNVENIRSLLSHTFTLDYVMHNGKTIRQALLESGDDALIRIANGIEKVDSKPEGVFY